MENTLNEKQKKIVNDRSGLTMVDITFQWPNLSFAADDRLSIKAAIADQLEAAWIDSFESNEGFEDLVQDYAGRAVRQIAKIAIFRHNYDSDVAYSLRKIIARCIRQVLDSN